MWRGKRLLAVAYLEQKTNIGSLEKIRTDEWEKDRKGKIRVEKERGEKKGELRILEDQYEQGSWCVMSA
jgi:hypothetical protein